MDEEDRAAIVIGLTLITFFVLSILACLGAIM